MCQPMIFCKRLQFWPVWWW